MPGAIAVSRGASPTDQAWLLLCTSDVFRTQCFVAAALLWAPACADFEGDRHDAVVTGRNVELRDELPEGYIIIGEVSADEENTVDGSSAVDRSLWCDLDDRIIRQMKRVAARNGGELLIAAVCESDEFEDVSPEYDDPDTWQVETSLTCWTECFAEVARSSSRS
jgi:hypothetical protein